ncbi:hypothetical protein M404DRAFT_992518 [Pisolithus tinctorius Marx 270]|uniref:Uncharacterized protein n=1 Tax=Pisolithus tinctorius Marx 270 TaxID=870435 RepID=A0A0C3PJD0_PISTI|nr:hypothetical protein M404DRAFT_992518 [Pisolithus tinctorius Marx 270]
MGRQVRRLFSRFIGELTVLRYQSVLRRYAEDTGDFVARSSLFEWFSTGPRDHIGLVKPILLSASSVSARMRDHTPDGQRIVHPDSLRGPLGPGEQNKKS